MSYIHQALVRDRSLILSIDESLRNAAGEWMPSLAEESSDDHPLGPSIRVDRGNIEPFRQPESPALMLGRVKAWVDSRRGFAMLAAASGEMDAIADLKSRVATVVVQEDAHPSPADLTSLLTITAALLLLRDGRSAIHAAAVVHPQSGEAWLLCGDSHSGKSTTTANLIKAGWSYLSDDYVVLMSDGDAISIEGWPDDFHIDEGWSKGESTGVRGTLKEADLPSNRRRDSAIVAGVFFTHVAPDSLTSAIEVPPVIALERLIRQSPWLVADAESAGKVFDLLKETASLPCAELSVGLDSFAAPPTLDRAVRKFTDQPRPAPELA